MEKCIFFTELEANSLDLIISDFGVSSDHVRCVAGRRDFLRPPIHHNLRKRVFGLCCGVCIIGLLWEETDSEGWETMGP